MSIAAQRRRLTEIAGVVTVLPILIGCGSNKTDPPDPTQPATDAAVSANIQRGA